MKSAALLFAASLGLGIGSAVAEDFPIEIKLPSECQLKHKRSGTWVCDYIADNGRDRRIMLDYHVIALDQEGRTTLSGLDARSLEHWLKKEIRSIDEQREAARPPGDYSKLRYDFMKARLRPDGFVSCSTLQDAMRLEGSDYRSDRASLHCWAAEPSRGELHQMLLSLIEQSDPSQETSATLSKEFDTLVGSIQRD